MSEHDLSVRHGDDLAMVTVTDIRGGSTADKVADALREHPDLAIQR